MIDKSRLCLCKITVSEYVRVMEKLGRHREEGRYDSETDCFTKIVDNLVYPSFSALLEEFMQTPRARYVSIKVGHKDWEKYHVENGYTMNLEEKPKMIDEDNISEIVKKAMDVGFIYLAFSSKFRDGKHKIPNNELSFEPTGKEGIEVTVASMEIPGEEWMEYSWLENPQKEYEKIRGLYVPREHTLTGKREFAHHHN